MFVNGLTPSCTALAFALLLPSSALCQGVTGSVFDAETSAPLAGVLVSLLDEDDTRVRAALSDSLGRFTLRADEVGTYRIRAQRIGMRTTTTDWLELSEPGLRLERIAMRDRAVEIEGLVVNSSVQACKIESGEAVQIQRWWAEARKALEVNALVQDTRLERVRVYRFEREWSADLRSLLSERRTPGSNYTWRPFVSMSAEALAQDGFIQGPAGQRQYFAPDADVLLSDVFLSRHCFSLIRDEQRPHSVGLRFEPTWTREQTDILGVLWVDTVTAELSELEYLYTNLPDDLPGDEAGGRVRFRYQPSGAWVVSEWWIRMPKVGVRRERGPWGTRDVHVLVGYVDEGGRARGFAATTEDLAGGGASGHVRGIVYDSLHSRPLVRARVVITGTRFSTMTDGNGAFVLDDVPSGMHELTFFHLELSNLGIASPVHEVDVSAGDTLRVSLAVPGFTQIGTSLCRGSMGPLGTILVGRVVDSSGEPTVNTLVQARWREGAVTDGRAREMQSEVYTGSSGRYIMCGLPVEARVEVRVRSGKLWVGAFDTVLYPREVVFRETELRGGG